MTEVLSDTLGKNTPPIHRTPDEILIAGRVAVRDELGEVFTPLTLRAAECIDNARVHQSAVLQEACRPAADPLPYGRAYMYLEPDLFGDDPPVIVRTPGSNWADSPNVGVVMRYLERKNPARAAQCREFHERTGLLENDVTGILRDMHNAGEGPGSLINPTHWQQHRRTAQQLEWMKGARRRMRDLQLHRQRNVHDRIASATEQYSHYRYDFADTATPNNLVNHVLVPVGGYGADFAQRLLAATTFSIGTVNADSQIFEMAWQAVREHHDILRIATARGSDSKQGPTANSTKATLLEGIVSTMQACALLMAERVPGRDDPYTLLQEIAELGLVERVTRLMPLGMVGPLALDGRHFPQPLQVNGENRIELSPGFVQTMREEHGAYMRWAKQYRKTGNPYEFGLGVPCPVSGTGEGQHELTVAFARTVRDARSLNPGGY